MHLTLNKLNCFKIMKGVFTFRIISWCLFDMNTNHLIVHRARYKRIFQATGQWRIKGNDNISKKSNLAQKLYDLNIVHVNITKPSIAQFLHNQLDLFICYLLNHYCFIRPLFTAFRPNHWFQIWPPAVMYIVGGSYYEMSCMKKMLWKVGRS